MSHHIAIEDNVMQNPKGYEEFGSAREGTVHATIEEFIEAFGAPHEEDPSGDKCTKWWHFETPRGRVTVRNWWSNSDGVLSLCSTNNRAAIWAAAYFRRCNINANARYNHE